MDAAGSFLRENGLNDGLQKLISRADDQTVKDSLELFSKHLFEAGINTNEFSNNPLKYFNPFTNTQTEKQDWWNKLTSECHQFIGLLKKLQRGI